MDLDLDLISWIMMSLGVYANKQEKQVEKQQIHPSIFAECLSEHENMRPSDRKTRPIDLAS